jgi:hypothetical protein
MIQNKFILTCVCAPKQQNSCVANQTGLHRQWLLSFKRKILLSHKSDRSKTMQNVVQTAFSVVVQIRPEEMLEPIVQKCV